MLQMTLEIFNIPKYIFDFNAIKVLTTIKLFLRYLFDLNEYFADKNNHSNNHSRSFHLTLAFL